MNEEEIRKMIDDNSSYVISTLNHIDNKVEHHFKKTNTYNSPDHVNISHNAGWDRDLNLTWIINMIDHDVGNYIMITGDDTYRKLAFVLAKQFNKEGEISPTYLKKTITKSNVILLNGGLLPLKNLKVYDTPIIAIDGLNRDTITRIYVINTNSIKTVGDDGYLEFKFSKEHPLGIIKDLMH